MDITPAIPDGMTAERFIELSIKLQGWVYDLHWIHWRATNDYAESAEEFDDSVQIVMVGFRDVRTEIEKCYQLVASAVGGPSIVDLSDQATDDASVHDYLACCATSAHEWTAKAVGRFVNAVEDLVIRDRDPSLEVLYEEGFEWSDAWISDSRDAVVEAAKRIPTSVKTAFRLQTMLQKEQYLVCTAWGHSAPPAPEDGAGRSGLVTIRMIATLVDLEESTVYGYSGDWPPPEVPSSGRRPAKWSYRKLLPKLHEQFPKQQFPPNPALNPPENK